ncbi:unnamed protein product, partial [Candidula unifasciata]
EEKTNATRTAEAMSIKYVRCTNCARCMPEDNAIVEVAAVREMSDASICEISKKARMDRTPSIRFRPVR